MARSLVLLLAAPVLPVFAEAPEGVSPGGARAVIEVEGRCPSFSWGAVPGSRLYQLVGYRLPDDMTPATLDLSRAEEALYTEVAGAATSWTPGLGQCLEPGGAYVWFVRALALRDGEEDLVPGEWSAGRFFAVSAAPSAAEVEEALDLLSRYSARSEDAHGADARAAERDIRGAVRPSSRRHGGAPEVRKSVTSARTAIRGALSDPSGETYGVVGISSSPAGAGLAAANTADGPDLVLDGSSEGLADAELSQSGIDRNSSYAETFTIANSGPGSMTLVVDGSITGNGSLLTGVDAATLDGIEGSAFATDAEMAGLIATHAASGDHDGRYFTETELATGGGGGAVDWENLTNVPAGLSDGDDDTVPVLPGSAWGMHSVRTVDTAGDVGRNTAIAIGADGLPVMSYYDATNYHLKLAHCSDLTCSAATLQTVDSTGQVGQFTSIAIGSDGLPVISYLDSMNFDLKLAHCSDLTCSAATLRTVDSTEGVGDTSSIAIGSDGLPVISYYDFTNADLKLAHCSDLTCSAATLRTIDSAGDVGAFTSIAIGADGLPVISYSDSTNFELKLAHCSDLTCSAAALRSFDAIGQVGDFTSVTIGADSLPVISYYDHTADDLMVAHCSDLTCSAATLQTLDSTGDVGRTTSIAIGADGLPVISYNDYTNGDLRLAHCSDLTCSAATLQTLDSAGNVGLDTSIAIGVDGLPIISYSDYTNLDLKVVHCSNPFCVPYARRR